MVEYKTLDQTFMALADPTRRHIISMLVEKQQMRVMELAEPFDISLAGTSKHIKVLERAGLVQRLKKGREHYLKLNPEPLKQAKDWLVYYENYWLKRFASLEKFLEQDQQSTKPTTTKSKPKVKTDKRS